MMEVLLQPGPDAAEGGREREGELGGKTVGSAASGGRGINTEGDRRQGMEERLGISCKTLVKLLGGLQSKGTCAASGWQSH